MSDPHTQGLIKWIAEQKEARIARLISVAQSSNDVNVQEQAVMIRVLDSFHKIITEKEET